jgi:excisionase family DNA binding protein
MGAQTELERKHITAGAITPAPKKLAVGPEEAARMLDMSRDTFDRIVKPEVRFVKRGRKVIIPVRELDAWLDRNAAVALEG